MIASSSSLGRLFLCLGSIAVRISPHFNSHLPYYFCVYPDYIQDGKKKYWSFEKCFRITDNSTKNTPYKENHLWLLFFFFFPPDQEIDKHINKLANDKHTPSLIPDRWKGSAPISSLLNKTVCCRWTTNGINCISYRYSLCFLSNQFA